MLQQSQRRLVLGFGVLEEIPFILRPLANEVVASYRRHHSDLRAVYAIGSVALGEWTEGVSDLDVVGVVECDFTTDDETARRQELQVLGKAWPQVLFINNSLLSLTALRTESAEMQTIGLARIIAISGLHLWGDVLDFQDYVPTVEVMAYERTARAKIQMSKFRAGLIIEPLLRNNPRLLARSCAKAAMRVFSSITILRGAEFYASPQKTFAVVAQYAPEALPLAQRAIAIVSGAEAEPNEAMAMTEQAIELFYSLYPVV